jgi:cytosine permease
MNNMLTFKVKEQDRQGGVGLFFIYGGCLICLPLLLLGGEMIGGLPLSGIIFCTVAGFLILFVYGTLVGTLGSATRLPSVALSAEGMGVLGARFGTALLLSITSVGWFGIQAAACGASFSAITAKILGVFLPPWIGTVFWGLAMTWTAMLGFQALKFLNYIMVPILLLILGYMVVLALSGGSISLPALFGYRPAASLSLAAGISRTVGVFAMGGLVTGDYCRYVKTRRGLALSLFAGMVILGSLTILSGAIFRIALGNPDITLLLVNMGLPAMALIGLIFAAWTSNVLNAYSGSIAVSILLGIEEKRFKRTTAITGLTGTILGAAGILSLFSDFLSLLSSLVPPIAGIIIAARLGRILESRRAGKGGAGVLGSAAGDFAMRPGFHLPGLLAYALGALTGAIPFLIPPLNGIIVAMAAFLILERFMPGKPKIYQQA